MSRRDTIVVAVLVNLALLAVLMMMAVKTEEATAVVVREETLVPITQNFQKEEIKQKPPEPPEESIIAARDEIDNVLQKYAYRQLPPVVSTPVSEQMSLPSLPKYVEVTVKRGDYLEKIAKANGTTVAAIMRANDLPNAQIAIGQVLRIPLSEKTVSTSVSLKKEEPIALVTTNDPQYYTIKSGDNPWKIAKQFNVRFSELLKLNDLDEQKARSLKPGDVLRVK